MNYRIIDKEAFKVVGVSKSVTCVDGENLKVIPKFWDECYSNGTCKKLSEMAGSLGMLGICADFEYEKDKLNYLIAVEKPEGEVSAELTVREIPAATWAIFESIGPMPHAIQKVWGRIFSEWFPATGYEHANAPELEVYPAGDASASDYKCEIWIPIIKK